MVSTPIVADTYCQRQLFHHRWWFQLGRFFCLFVFHIRIDSSYNFKDRTTNDQQALLGTFYITTHKQDLYKRYNLGNWKDFNSALFFPADFFQDLKSYHLRVTSMAF